MRNATYSFMSLILAIACLCTPALEAAEDYYTEEKVYFSRPNPARGKKFDHVGPTGIHAYINPGVLVTVESVAKDSPAAGKFKKGDVLTGVNGTALKGKNPFVVIGKAITEAEATDGKPSRALPAIRGSRTSISVGAVGDPEWRWRSCASDTPSASITSCTIGSASISS